MSNRLGRVVSDLSYGNHRTATDHDRSHHQSTSNIRDSSDVAGGKAKQRLSLLFSGVSPWRRSDGTGDASRAKSKTKKKPEGTSRKRRGLDIGQAVSKYLSMVEQLFTTSSSAGVQRKDRSSTEPRRRLHTFTSSRGCSNAPPKRHEGRLSSAPASLGGSPANSGHLSVGESVKMSTSSSELSTMEELRSAIQAAIAHCKSTAAVAGKQAAAGDDRCKC